MDTDDQEKKTNKAGGDPAQGAPPTPTDTPSEETPEPVDPVEAKGRAYRELKPVGPIMKPLSDEEVQRMLYDAEDKEREHLLDARPKPDTDDHDGFRAPGAGLRRTPVHAFPGPLDTLSTRLSH